VNPRYPIYVPSKGRSERALALTARFLRADGVPFKLVVEPQEREAYAAAWGEDSLLVLPFSNLGLGSTPARNWIWGHAVASGAERHWILDDNIRYIRRWWRGRRLMCDSGPALAACEDFADRYENLAMAGLNYQMFCIQSAPPFYLNVHVYSCILIMNSLPFRWRGRYNEDTDLCLQVLSSGWCTALINVFMANKLHTMTMRGGNTDQLYQGDGRLRMARSLERVWPYVVATKRRFKRPQHVIRGAWRGFDTPLRLKPGAVVDAAPNEYGLRLEQVKDVRSAGLQKLLGDSKKGR